jgi:uncharacterized protein with HEPN domain
MSKRADGDSLNDIKEAISRITEYTSEASFESFSTDKKTQDAVIRNMEIIGEAAKNISPQTREQYSAIPWKNMTGIRDRLIHDYFGVNIDIIWDIAKNELPKVLQNLN